MSLQKLVRELDDRRARELRELANPECRLCLGGGQTHGYIGPGKTAMYACSCTGRADWQAETMKVTGYIQRSNPVWTFSDHALQQLAEQAVGMPVTEDFDSGRYVGRVAEATVDGDGVRVEIVVEGGLPQGLLNDLGTGFVVKKAEERAGAGTYRCLEDADFHEITIPRKP